MNEDEIMQDMQNKLFHFIVKHGEDRQGYEQDCEGIADLKGMPSDVKGIWVNFALDVYDKYFENLKK